MSGAAGARAGAFSAGLCGDGGRRRTVRAGGLTFGNPRPGALSASGPGGAVPAVTAAAYFSPGTTSNSSVTKIGDFARSMKVFSSASRAAAAAAASGLR